MKILIVMTILILSGCSVIRPITDTKEAFAVCKTADVVATKVALNHGAVEANPLMSAIIHKLGFMGFVGLSALLVWYVWENEEKIPEGVLSVASVATCAVATHNLMTY